jgi:hypothetical protein
MVETLGFGKSRTTAEPQRWAIKKSFIAQRLNMDAE